MRKVAEACPAGTATDAGTVAGAAWLLSATVAPPIGAGADSLTEPLTVRPPRMMLEGSASEYNCAALDASTSSAALSVAPPACAVMVALPVKVEVVTLVLADAAP